MTATGSSGLWQLGEAFDLVPAPPDPELAALLRSWWHEPRRFGCATARTGLVWVVVAPDLRLWCPGCAADRFAVEKRCVYCGRLVRPVRSVVLHFEMAGAVRVLARSHQHCMEKARKRDG